jgi:elongation factor Ts
MSISAQDVKNLREKTGAGMMDCKTALNESGGDFEKAVDFLKKQGLAKAVKKGDRIAAEGLIFAKVAASEAILLELNCETDFVAKNDDFIKLGNQLADIVLKSKPASVDEALGLKVGAQTAQDLINSLIAVIGEKISLRRFTILKPQQSGKMGFYSHMGGKMAVLLEVTGGFIGDDTIKDLAMQVVAMSPQYIDKSEVPVSVMDREKAIQLETLKTSGKPVEILEKIIVGKLDKFASEMSLLQQVFIKDTTGKKTVAQHLKEIDPTTKIVQFKRYAVGEGIEKKKDDFAEEVAKMVS